MNKIAYIPRLDSIKRYYEQDAENKVSDRIEIAEQGEQLFRKSAKTTNCTVCDREEALFEPVSLPLNPIADDGKNVDYNLEHVRKLEKENDELRSTITTLQKSITALTRERDTLKESHESKRELYALACQEQAKSRGSITVLETSIAEVTADRDALRDDILVMQKESREKVDGLLEEWQAQLERQYITKDEMKNTIDKLTNERNNWEETAAQFLRNQEYYSGLIDKAIGHIPSAYCQDDGGKVTSVLRAKLPEIVNQLETSLAESEAKCERLQSLNETQARQMDKFEEQLAESEVRIKGLEICLDRMGNEHITQHNIISKLDEQLAKARKSMVVVGYAHVLKDHNSLKSMILWESKDLAEKTLQRDSEVAALILPPTSTPAPEPVCIETAENKLNKIREILK